MQVNEKHKFHTTFHPGSIKQLCRVSGLKKNPVYIGWKGMIKPSVVCQAAVTLRAAVLVPKAAWQHGSSRDEEVFQVKSLLSPARC